MFKKNILTLLLALIAQTVFSQSDIVINEICNNPPLEFDTEDWVELYNNGSGTVDLTGWELKDDDDTHVFTFPSVQLSAGAYLVVCRDQAAFESLQSGITTTGDFDFGLSSDGDCVRLFNASGATMDEVCYEEEAPWSKANLGRTLGLKDPNLDNSLASSWQLISNNGSPGSMNEFSTILSTPKLLSNLAYPNPVNGQSINVQLANQKSASVVLISMDGSQINLSRINDTEYSIPSSISNGIYYVKVTQEDITHLQKIIVAR